MTPEAFKKEHPQYAHLEDDALWDTMTLEKLKSQQATEVIKGHLPFWKTHTLRWLFYRKSKGWDFGKNDWSSSSMCCKCKKGMTSYFIMFNVLGKSSVAYCPHGCGETTKVPNTTLSHKAYLAVHRIKNSFWWCMDKIHLVRSSNSRYDMFGDESRYVARWGFNMETGESTIKFKPRKWWEYVVIEKSVHNSFKF